MSRSRLIRRALRERFLVTTTAGTFDGVLIDADGRHYVLADAAALGEEGKRTPIDGYLWLPAEAVSYLQRPVT